MIPTSVPYPTKVLGVSPYDTHYGIGPRVYPYQGGPKELLTPNNVLVPVDLDSGQGISLTTKPERRLCNDWDRGHTRTEEFLRERLEPEVVLKY